MYSANSGDRDHAADSAHSALSPRIDVAVLGATGTVGGRFIQLLQGHPWFRVAEVAASERSVGKTYREAAHWVLPGDPPTEVASLTVLPLDADFKSPIVMSALPGDVAKALEPELAARGHIVSSNTSSHRMGLDVPLLLPEVNPDHAYLVDVQRKNRGWADGALVTMSNCTVVSLIVALAPLMQAGFAVERVNVVSMQALSGAGYPGVASFDSFDNVIPFIGGEEDKMTTETRKILGRFNGASIDWPEMAISAACNRVPVLDGHLVCASVGFRNKPTPDQIREAWAAYQPPALARALPSIPNPVIYHAEGDDRPQTRRDRENGRGMSTTVGRLRECAVLDYKFVALSHNTIRGAAGGAILNAELLAALGYIRGVDVRASTGMVEAETR